MGHPHSLRKRCHMTTISPSDAEMLEAEDRIQMGRGNVELMLDRIGEGDSMMAEPRPKARRGRPKRSGAEERRSRERNERH